MLWIWLLAVLRAIDLGLDTGGGSLLSDLPLFAVSLAELSAHVTALAALQSRRRWGWVLALVWYPVWIAAMTVRLYLDYNMVLALMWSPLLAFTAIAHGVLLRRDVAEAFGVRRGFWHSLSTWLPYAVRPGSLVLAVSYAFGMQTALCLWITATIAAATRPQIYRGAG